MPPRRTFAGNCGIFLYYDREIEEPLNLKLFMKQRLGDHLQEKQVVKTTEVENTEDPQPLRRFRKAEQRIV